MYALQGLTNPVRSIPIVHEMIAYLDDIIAADGNLRGARGSVNWQRDRRVSFVSLYFQVTGVVRRFALSLRRFL